MTQTPATHSAEAHNSMEMRAPDLISGIGLLTTRETTEEQGELQGGELMIEPRDLLRQSFRQRASSITTATTRRQRSRRRANSINMPQLSTPSRLVI